MRSVVSDSRFADSILRKHVNDLDFLRRLKLETADRIKIWNNTQIGNIAYIVTHCDYDEYKILAYNVWKRIKRFTVE